MIIQYVTEYDLAISAKIAKQHLKLHKNLTFWQSGDTLVEKHSREEIQKYQYGNKMKYLIDILRPNEDDIGINYYNPYTVILEYLVDPTVKDLEKFIAAEQKKAAKEELKKLPQQQRRFLSRHNSAEIKLDAITGKPVSISENRRDHCSIM